MTNPTAPSLADEQPLASQRAGSEEAQHPVAAVEAGGDRLAGEGGGDDRQGEHPCGRDVDAAPGPEVGDVAQGEGEQGQGGEHERDERLLAVPQDGGGLEPRLCRPAP